MNMARIFSALAAMAALGATSAPPEIGMIGKWVCGLLAVGFSIMAGESRSARQVKNGNGKP